MKQRDDKTTQRQQRQHIAALTRQATKVDDQTVDQLYGLEPVIDPAAESNRGMDVTQFVVVLCPYCAESFETQIDLTAGSFNYVEDCQVCCQPIDLHVTVNEAGELTGISEQRLDA